MQLLARGGQQRPDQAALPKGALFGHRRKATQAGTSQQAKKHGFGLVVAVLGSEQDVSGTEHADEGCIASVAGSLFEAGAGGDLDVDDLEFDTELVADGLAVSGPGVGSKL
jgi:hypothetical protein